jgi:glycosyltransferase involved in cell wall biosynthesis
VDVPPVSGPRWWKESRRAFLSLQKEFSFDRLISESFSAFSLSSLKDRPPMAAFLHGFCPEHVVNRWQEVRGGKDLLRYFLVQVPEMLFYSGVERRFCRSVEQVWTVSQRIQKLIRFYGAAPEHVSFFPNWLDDDFHPKPGDREIHRRQWGAGSTDAVFLFNSVLNRQKGGRVAVRAFAEHAKRMKKSKLVIVGSGEEKDFLQREASGLVRESRVLFLGHRPHREIAGLLSAADVFVLPTLRLEGLPYSILEAAFCGLPCITTSLGGIPEALGEHAFYTPPGKIAPLAEAMDKLAASLELRSSVGRASQEEVKKRFSTAPALEKMRAWLRM